jgi:hypothetical protein
MLLNHASQPCFSTMLLNHAFQPCFLTMLFFSLLSGLLVWTIYHFQWWNASS